MVFPKGIVMTHEQFQALAAQGYNRIPVMREVLADLDPNSNVIADVRCDCTRRMCTRRVSRMYPKRVRISLESEAPSKIIELAIFVPESF